MKPILTFLVGVISILSLTANAASVTLTDVNNAKPGDGNYSGFYAGFYSLTVDGKYIQGMCDDFATNSYIGETWTANFNNGSTGKFSPNPVKYSQIGYLFSLALSDHNTDNQASYNEAIWKIIYPSAPALLNDASYYYNLATNGSHDSFNYSGIMQFLTPNPLNASQEFLTAPTEVKVPSAMWLFGSGLLGLVGISRRKNK